MILGSSSLSYVPITHKNLNKGKTTNLYFNFSPDEARLQFEEIFIEEIYKKGRIKKDMVILDIGAAMGLSALYFKDYAKMIYACEPFPDVYESAVKNTSYANIKCFQIGIAGSTREATLYGYNNQPAATMEIRPDITSTEQVQFMAIDDFFAENKINHLDLLKIDCEGAEYEIFCSEGFEKVAPKIDYIIGEAHLQPPYYPFYIPEMLKENGFKTQWLPFDNFTQEVHIRRPDGSIKKYKSYLKTLFFAKRI